MVRGQTGLTIRGNSIQMSFTYEGIRCRESIPMPPTKTALKELALKRQAILYEIKTGQFDYLKHFPNSKKAKEFRKFNPSHYRISEGLKEWLKNAEQRCQHSTLRDYNSAVYHHIIPVFGKLNIDELTAKEIREWLAGLPISNKRKNNILIPLRGFYDELFQDETIDKNPLDRVNNLPVKSREPEPFTQREIDLILEQLEGHNKNLIQFAFWSGLRTSELIALKWEDVNFKDQTVFVCRAKVKGIIKGTKTTSGERKITLEPQALQALLTQQDITKSKEGFIFLDPKTNQCWKTDQPIRKRVWIPALKKANLSYRNPYQTRPTYALHMLSRGENPMWVAQQMGHKDWGMIRKVYGRWIKQ